MGTTHSKHLVNRRNFFRHGSAALLAGFAFKNGLTVNRLLAQSSGKYGYNRIFEPHPTDSNVAWMITCTTESNVSAEELTALYKSTDGSRTWQAQDIVGPNGLKLNAYDIKYNLTGDSLYLLHHTPSTESGMERSGVYKLDGVNWIATDFIGWGANYLVRHRSLNNVFYAIGRDREIFRTSDGWVESETWFEKSFDAGSGYVLDLLISNDGSEGWALVNGVPGVTHSSGTYMPIPGLINPTATNGILHPSNEYLFVSGTAPDDYPYRSKDRGQTWEPLTWLDPHSSDRILDWAILPNGDIMALGMRAQILVSSDYGDTWIKRWDGLSGGDQNNYTTKIVYVGDNIYTTTDGFHLLSTDGGVLFAELSAYVPAQVDVPVTATTDNTGTAIATYESVPDSDIIVPVSKIAVTLPDQANCAIQINTFSTTDNVVDDTVGKQFQKTLGKKETVMSIDAELSSEGEEATVKLEIGAVPEEDSVTVYHYNSSSDMWSPLSTSYQNGIVSFQTNSFSYFKVVVGEFLLESGDVNQDGKTDIFDLLKQLQVLSGSETDPGIVAQADVTGDGKTNIFDLLELLNILSGK
jgi:Dockerin type I domain